MRTLRWLLVSGALELRQHPSSCASWPCREGLQAVWKPLVQLLCCLPVRLKVWTAPQALWLGPPHLPLRPDTCEHRCMLKIHLCSMQSVTSMATAQTLLMIDTSVRAGCSLQSIVSIPTACGT